MAGCVLRIKSKGFDPEPFLKVANWDAARVFEDGFNFVVSESDDVEEQIEDAIAFVGEERINILRLQEETRTPSRLDFGAFFGEMASYSFSLPPKLVEAVASVGLGVEVSVYARDA